MTHRHVLGLTLLGLCALSCQNATPRADSAPKASCAPARSGHATPLSTQSSAVALVRQGEKTLAYVVDADDSTLRTVDVDSMKELSTTRLAGVPAQVLALSDGRVAVTLRSKNQVAVLEPQAAPDKPLETRCNVSTAAEPIALAEETRRGHVLVTSGWGRALTTFRARDFSVQTRTALAREPRAVVVSNDGARAFVSHAVGGRISVVSLRGAQKAREVMLGADSVAKQSKLFGFLGTRRRSDSRRIGCQGFALAKSTDPGGRVLAPQVLVDPGDSSVQSSGYGDGFEAAELPSIAVLSERDGDVLDSSLSQTSAANSSGFITTPRAPCLLPRAAQVDGKSGALLVACLGIDSVVEYDAASADPRRAERRRFAVASGPLGLAVDERGRRAVVWSQFDRTLNVIDLTPEPILREGAPPHRPVTQLALSRSAAEPTAGDLALGRRLFHATTDPRISSDGRACASCHPDGREDSITWATPGGPRQTPMLAGRLARTAPYGWDGKGADVETHLAHTFQRLRGSGLSERELSALSAYVGSLPPPPALDVDPALAKRGEALFASKTTGCSSCHVAKGLGSDGKLHDVQSRVQADRDPRFDTPSLRFVAGTAPYFHDGRYSSLEELLRASDGKMGHTAHLSDGDVEALGAYLRTL